MNKFTNDTYKLNIVRKNENTASNADYEVLENSIAVPLYFKEGERGQFVVENEDESEMFKWHRILTSEVQLVDISNNGDINIETENTFYYFIRNKIKEI